MVPAIVVSAIVMSTIVMSSIIVSAVQSPPIVADFTILLVTLAKVFLYVSYKFLDIGWTVHWRHHVTLCLQVVTYAHVVHALPSLLVGVPLHELFV